MKKFSSLIFLFFTLIILSSCQEVIYTDIVTTMFPQYDFAQAIVGDDYTVSLLLPPGAEIHDYEVTSQDLAKIKESKLFIFTSLEIDNWIGDVETIGGKDTFVMNLSESFVREPLIYGDILDPLDEEGIHASELHFWTDPTIAVQLIDAILEQIIALDPQLEAQLRARATTYINEIVELDTQIKNYMIDHEYLGSTIYFAGHNALGAFGQRYGLNIVSLFEDFKPDVDLTSNELISFTNIVKQTNTHYLFIEELVFPKAANTIVNQLASDGYDLELLEFHGYHNISSSDYEKGVTYRDLLEQNFLHIQTVLMSTI
ncbi:MAG: metal ABC transporter substrate-binding protein [Acholeplasmataceae bacterium]|nr:metal ABC transporter substrate-binding protein [Acholeplasmataceae bacterium]